MQKLVKKEGESAKTTVRGVRREILDSVKKLASEDEQKRLEKQVSCSQGFQLKLKLQIRSKSCIFSVKTFKACLHSAVEETRHLSCRRIELIWLQYLKFGSAYRYKH